LGGVIGWGQIFEFIDFGFDFDFEKIIINCISNVSCVVRV